MSFAHQNSINNGLICEHPQHTPHIQALLLELGQSYQAGGVEAVQEKAAIFALGDSLLHRVFALLANQPEAADLRKALIALQRAYSAELSAHIPAHVRGLFLKPLADNSTAKGSLCVNSLRDFSREVRFSCKKKG